MPLLTIITQPHHTLRTRSLEVPVQEIGKLHDFISQFEKTMLERDGIGLAANQVNKLIRIIAISTKDGPMSVINPRLLRKSFKKEDGEEGCLSIPGVYGIVRRHQSLTVVGYDKEGSRISIKARGLLARVFQHEVDHLDGILFTDRAKSITKGNVPDEPKTL
ncbi:MAG: peptide deformylase [Patescibacteria group bacterium]